MNHPSKRFAASLLILTVLPTAPPFAAEGGGGGDLRSAGQNPIS